MPQLQYLRQVRGKHEARTVLLAGRQHLGTNANGNANTTTTTTTHHLPQHSSSVSSDVFASDATDMQPHLHATPAASLAATGGGLVLGGRYLDLVHKSA